ncbi:hypothetical protein RHMOL_Rhmol13G0209700 [Rhododendron molle]|uniref:Uncharacterized protein n=1 Tax=Rhododendron molle TaxID=49168 RepID=A0ACC0LA34_RHOML|nr:hypothetical protein RHMOL_Rhmol13G0209700 [Rhododendron molle]
MPRVSSTAASLLCLGAQLQVLYTVCSNTTNYTDNSRLEMNLNHVLHRGLYNDGGDSIFSTKTEGEPDKV